MCSSSCCVAAARTRANRAVEPPPPFEPLDVCEDVLAGYAAPRGPELSYGGSAAAYMSAMDHVRLPVREAFDCPSAFYATAFHELAHSTGHESRLKRLEIVEPNRFGSEPYGREELTAEMTAAMLAGHCGISPETEARSAAYVDHWLEAIRGDRKLVVVAAARAQRAADLILGPALADASPDDPTNGDHR